MGKEAVVLLSGGLDSATVLAIARSEGYAVRTLTFDYGQRHRAELQAAAHLADRHGSLEHIVFAMDFGQIGGSALTTDAEVPKDRDESQMQDIPVTYVPARNTVFLSIAAGFAEARDIRHVFLGVNAVDYSGYPDCRPEFLRAMQEAIKQGTKCGVEGDPIRLHAPLLDLTKSEIIQQGAALGVDYGQTHSCYDPSDAGLACGRCDACVLRRRGFEDAGVEDPTHYA